VSAQEHAVYCFADCELDVRERRLLVHGQLATLTPKVFDTLVLLVERAGHVVSKEELMAALWPRGFVHESNLTKHIWLIRRALCDGEDESRYIETVPKLGYRFVAPMRQVPAMDVDVAAASDRNGDAPGLSDLEPKAPAGNGGVADHPRVDRNEEPEEDGSAPVAGDRSRPIAVPGVIPAVRRIDRRWLTAAGLLLVALVGGLYLWRTLHVVPLGGASAPDAGGIAIVDFNNLSGNAKDAWLGPALEQMLATEIAANGRLHAVSEELVRPARADLPAPEAGGYSPASLASLQRRLGTHYVLSGAYLVSGAVDAPQLRIDITVQDTRTGKLFASLSHSAAVNDLPNLVAQAGGELRGHFGTDAASAVVLRQMARAQPPTAEVARHVGFALDALQKYDPARARDELLQAIAQAPGYAPAYLYLARAWAALGYRAKAQAAAEQAVANADGLPEEERLQIDAQQSDPHKAYGDSIAIREKLVALRPQNPEYRLQLIGAQIAGGRGNAADAALAAARKLSGAASDPRLELAAAQIAAMRGNARARVQHAMEALRLARVRGETGLIANAELQLGMALDRPLEAESTLRSAAADYRRIGNPHGEALAYQNLGNLFDSRSQGAAARENYQRAMMIYQGIGDLGGEAAIYDNLSRMLWAAGDRDGTETALRQALRIGRQTNDPARQAWSLTGLATVLSDEAASDHVAEMYREAIALDRKSNAGSHLVFSLSAYADLLRVRGQLPEARDACRQAQSVATALADASQKMSADFECTQIALDRGEVDAATKSFMEIEKSATETKDAFFAANAQMVLGQIEMGKLHWVSARNLLRLSVHGWADQKEVPGEATSEALLALCDAALGEAAERDQAATHARTLREQVTARQEIFYLDAALAELQAYAGEYDAGLAALRLLADDAAKRKWAGLAFEARLAQARVLERGGHHAAAKTARDALEADAGNAGFDWIRLRVATLHPSLTR
jgi:DNA-binding winged helix-turn-helix (wHTH) protein